MPPIRDVMPAFELFQPTSVTDALNVLGRHGADAWAMAGGNDTFDWLKDRIRKPRVVVDLSMVNELHGIKDAGGGLEIGATTTLTTIANDPLVKERFPMLAQAALLVASPQIRNVSTLGGNVAQDARCWYYRAGWPCYRAGGNICYADTPKAINREHAIFNADRCVAVNPSDTAPALVALDAQFVIKNGEAERVVSADEFFIGPGIDITKLTSLQPGDLLTSIRIPNTFAGKAHYFEKVRDRMVWDFALVNIAASFNTSGSSIGDARLVVNGVSATPYRLTAVEAFLRGKPRDKATADAAADMAVQGAVPLQHNAYKIPLMKALVKRAIRGDAEWTS
ncbi:MAG TPA: xanthine dehydrogenase family protein subunit M [Vicinamibacterales bacterium]|nr:xanthine dehydrogenase family protein subunit M [Vicinamibacterales bacterium]